MMISPMSNQMIDLEQLESHFRENGWMVVKLPNPEPVYATRAGLLKELRQLTGDRTITLEDYHKVVKDKEVHTELHIRLGKFFRKEQFGKKIISAQVDFLKALLGRDLNVQSDPYLRITRPGKPEDNIGYHRDTFYGCSAFELSVLVPYVDVPVESTISILPGSHIRPESDFPTTQVDNAQVEKGSDKHRILGVPYSYKVIDPACTANMQPVPLKLGEAVIFSLATVHGSVENRGKNCRWSSDIRVVNSLALLQSSVKPGFYEQLSSSVVSEIANTYNKAQLASLT